MQGIRIQSKRQEGHITARILAGGKSLVLQKIQRIHSGNYTCVAYNLEGEAVSNIVKIDVLCKFIAKLNLLNILARVNLISPSGSYLPNCFCYQVINLANFAIMSKCGIDQTTEKLGAVCK